MVYLIYGSPCSGKSTYIKEHIGENDIVCDIDLIYGAIGNHDTHDTDICVYDTASKITEYLLDIIRNRDGDWDNAYVVSTANTNDQLKKAVERAKADKCVFINTPYEVCMERTKDRPPYFRYLVAEWFEMKDFGRE